MKATNLRDPTETVSFSEAIRRGLGRNRGLFFPDRISPLDVDVFACDPQTRAVRVLASLLGGEIDESALAGIVGRAFTWDTPLVPVTDRIQALELFGGPTLAFKDYGARFMAEALAHLHAGRRVTILTATSGDTGAAVAHAFYRAPGIDCVVLYPKGRISRLQEQLFCTLGHNVHTLSVEGTFDDCQALVKQAFDDPDLVSRCGLNSANSINLARLVAQVTYFFEAAAQIPPDRRDGTVYCVPSGNFGDLTAALMAKAMGLPAKRFIAATNANDTVPRYLSTGVWEPRATVPTLSNAMDVSVPSNWPRIETLMARRGWGEETLTTGVVDDARTEDAIRRLDELGYRAGPHGAVAFDVLEQRLGDDETGVFLCTAHPAKFKETVDRVLGIDVALPPALAERAELPLLSEHIGVEFEAVKEALCRL
jgi:threonine synthase